MHANSKIAGFFFGLLVVVQPAPAVSAEKSECRPPEEQHDDSSEETNRGYFEQQFTIAERLRQAAATAGAEWLETEGLLVRSRKVAGSGDWGTALQLVHKACLQGKLALQQANYELEAWKRRVVD